MSNQAQQVQDYLLGAGRTSGITGIEALNKFGVGHLPSVMFRIGRNLPPGVEVHGDWETKDGGPHGKKSFKRYWLRAAKRDDRQGTLPGLDVPPADHFTDCPRAADPRGSCTCPASGPMDGD